MLFYNSDRARKWDEHLNKISKYEVGMSSKKPQRKELLTSERSSGSTVKIGSQLHRNTSEIGSQKFDDRPKNGVLNKRVRTSVADPRVQTHLYFNSSISGIYVFILVHQVNFQPLLYFPKCYMLAGLMSDTL